MRLELARLFISIPLYAGNGTKLSPQHLGFFPLPLLQLVLPPVRSPCRALSPWAVLERGSLHHGPMPLGDALPWVLSFPSGPWGN